jgi:hypothetical protein
MSTERLNTSDDGYDSQQAQLGPYPGGINNIAEETDIPPGQLKSQKNVDATNAGNLRRRAGYLKKMALGDGHSLWSDQNQLLTVESGRLVRLHPDSGTKDDLGPIEADRAVSYDATRGVVVLSNGKTIGSVRGKAAASYGELGCETPNGAPTIAATSGGALRAAFYGVAINYRNAHKEEGGARESAWVQVATDGGKIVLTDIPQPNDSESTIQIWMTAPGDDGEPYHQITLEAGITTVEIAQFTRSRRRLKNQFLDAMPAGQIVRFFNGRLFVADGETFWYSEPWAYWLTSTDENHGPMAGEDIDIMEPVDDGVFVAAGAETLFYSGDNPEAFVPRSVFQYPAVPGTGARLHPSNVGDGQGGSPLAYWFTARGGVIGRPGGKVDAMSDKSVAVPEYESGASGYIEGNGLRKILSTTFNRSGAARMASSDSAECFVKRCGE